MSLTKVPQILMITLCNCSTTEGEQRIFVLESFSVLVDEENSHNFLFMEAIWSRTGKFHVWDLQIKFICFYFHINWS